MRVLVHHPGRIVSPVPPRAAYSCAPRALRFLLRYARASGICDVSVQKQGRTDVRNAANARLWGKDDYRGSASSGALDPAGPIASFLLGSLHSRLSESGVGLGFFLHMS